MTEPHTAGRFVLVSHTPTGWNGYCTSWETFEEATAALPITERGLRLVDTKTGVYWTHLGMFQ